MRRYDAFTLIELLVVVAIIGILAAIAIPNFLNAQTRAKVAKAQAEMKMLELAIESYAVDNNSYPTCTGVGIYHSDDLYPIPVSLRLIPLTEPIAYITSVPVDIFQCTAVVFEYPKEHYDTYDYFDISNRLGGSGSTSGGAWRLASAGPDLFMAWGGQRADIDTAAEACEKGVDYDPTNGATSTGDIVRVGPVAPTGNGMSPADLNNPERPGILRVPFYREQY